MPRLDEYDQATGRQLLEHSVTIELRYLKAKTEDEARRLITPYLKSKGWRYKFHQGRHAMERFVCRPCMTNIAIMEHDWARKCAGDRKQNTFSYYGDLCVE